MEQTQPQIRSILYVDLGREPTPPQPFLDVAHLARQVGSSLTLWGAPVGNTRRRIPAPGRPRNRRQLSDRLVQETTERFDLWLGSVDRSVRTIAEVSTGRWSDAISAELRDGGHELVVVHNTGGSQAIRRIRRLVRSCNLPLLVVLNELRTGVVAELHADDPLQLNARIIRLTSAVADGLGCQATFVCPVDASADAQRTAEVDRRLSRLAAEIADTDPGDVSVGIGLPSRLVEDQAKREGADLVVIGGSGRLGTKSKVLGNTAEQLLSTTSRSVLIVEPTAASLDRPARRLRRTAH